MNGQDRAIMDEAALREMWRQVAGGELEPDEAVRLLQKLPFSELGYATVDHHRALRTGLPEVVYAPGKDPGQCAGIVLDLLSADGRSSHGASPVLLSRANEQQIAAALEACPGGEVRGSTVVWRAALPREEQVVVVTAGTADLTVAEECVAVLGAFGFDAKLVADVGVAGLHRLLAKLDMLTTADVVVVVAGMEGALASVVAGLVSAPIVAVPTSAGYGASLEGVTALLSMLASCSPGIAVVGIDNGLGAACVVARLLGARSRVATT
jgi:NCAIR mutase (PurE)-related protein